MLLQIFLICLCIGIFIPSDGVEAKEDYSEKELTAIKKFRERMGNALYREYMKSDPYLIRWLEVAKFDQTLAAERLTKTLKWRKEQRIDGILNETIWEFKIPAFYYAGLDPKGGAVNIFRLNSIDVRNHLLNQRQQLFLRYWYQWLESIEIQIMASLGALGNSSVEHATRKGVLIGDGAGFNLRQHFCLICVPMYVQMVRDFVEYYPGHQRVVIFLNMPRTAMPFVELVKPLLKNQFEEGLKVFGTDRAEWIKYIRQFVGPEKVGIHLGGTRNLTIAEGRTYFDHLYKISQQGAMI